MCYVQRFLKNSFLIILIYGIIIHVHISLHQHQNQQQRKTKTLPSFTAAKNCVDSRRRTGRCVKLAMCPQLVEEFYKKSSSGAITMDIQTFISDSICGFDGRNFLICCVGSLSISTPPGKLVTTTSSPSLQLPFGSFFQFAPLSTASTDSSVYLTTSTPQKFTQIKPTNTPPVVFEPTTVSNPPAMALPTPTIKSNNNPPTPLPVLINPTPIVFKPTSTSPVVVNTLPPTLAPAARIEPTTDVMGECGISRGTTNRVVGGAEARHGSYPWIAALGYYDKWDRNKLRFQCAGSLISRRYVLTSAHCANPTLDVARLGAHDLSRPLEANSTDIRIKRIILHEAFNMRSIANDIALLELNASAPLSTTISPICLPTSDYFLTQEFVGMQPFIAGWGAVKHQAPASNVLRDTQVPIVSRQTCEASYKNIFTFIEFSDKLICAGNSNVDACQGDSGGPLMLPIQINDGSYRYFLLGIVSYGYECARVGFPGVYTRVASYLPWIRANTI